MLLILNTFDLITISVQHFTTEDVETLSEEVGPFDVYCNALMSFEECFDVCRH